MLLTAVLGAACAVTAGVFAWAGGSPALARWMALHPAGETAMAATKTAFYAVAIVVLGLLRLVVFPLRLSRRKGAEVGVRFAVDAALILCAALLALFLFSRFVASR